MRSPAKPAPVLFLGHGNPLNAIEETTFSRAWQALGAQLPRPRAILCISAHWESSGAKVTAMTAPPTIHDFYGFPEALYRVHYPAPGSPELAARVRELLGSELEFDESWGLDHGTWAVLSRIYPQAEIPVVQLSLDKQRTPAQHLALARRLAPLRDEGILIVGSGNLVHNLGLMRWHDPEPFPWAVEFDRLASELIDAGQLDRLADYPALGPAAQLSIPTNEHYLPLLYALALRRENEPLAYFAEGIVYGSISMRSLRIG